MQCVLKGICTADEWDQFKEHIYYDFIKDNNFSELKDAELMRERLSLLSAVDPYTGRYFSQAWIQRHVLRLTDDEIKEMQGEIDEEKEMGLGLPVGVTNDVAQAQMVGDVQADQQAALATHQNELQQAQDMGAQQEQKSVGTFVKLKQIL